MRILKKVFAIALAAVLAAALGGLVYYLLATASASLDPSALRPVQNKIGTATTYDTATIASNGQVANAFTVSYAALRYNK